MSFFIFNNSERLRSLQLFLLLHPQKHSNYFSTKKKLQNHPSLLTCRWWVLSGPRRHSMYDWPCFSEFSLIIISRFSLCFSINAKMILIFSIFWFYFFVIHHTILNFERSSKLYYHQRKLFHMFFEKELQLLSLKVHSLRFSIFLQLRIYVRLPMYIDFILNIFYYRIIFPCSNGNIFWHRSHNSTIFSFESSSKSSFYVSFTDIWR